MPRHHRCLRPFTTNNRNLQMIAFIFSLISFTFGCQCLSPKGCSRRQYMQQTFVAFSSGTLSPAFLPSSSTAIAVEDCTNTSADGATLRTKAVAEYTNSISASRDTNVSPKEAYETILQYIPLNKNGCSSKALDVGAGAGLSTSFLYDQLGYKDIDAVDWSGDAWRSNVDECPPSVRFYELDDDSFFSMQKSTSEQGGVDLKKYQVICYNFAVNPSKAIRVAREHLAADGILFAPINDRPEYWYKQTYYVLNARGEVIQKSDAEVGAWSVQFQPDVTSNTCTGIWCGDMNGFNQKRAKRQQLNQP